MASPSLDVGAALKMETRYWDSAADAADIDRNVSNCPGHVRVLLEVVRDHDVLLVAVMPGDGDFFIPARRPAIGASPTATVNTMRMSAEDTEYFSVQPNQFIAVISKDT